MQDFAEFYALGGLFNHVVTLLALAGVSSLVVHAALARRRAGDHRLLDAADRFAALATAAGVLGVAFGMMDVSAALATIPAELVVQAAGQSAGIVAVPLAWALMCAIPVWLASAYYRLRAPAPAR
jgi:hypothetical protein